MPNNYLRKHLMKYILLSFNNPLTCLRARIKERTGCFYGHRCYRSIQYLSGWVSSSSVSLTVVALGTLSTEVSTSYHLFGSWLSAEASGDKDFFRGRLSSDCRSIVFGNWWGTASIAGTRVTTGTAARVRRMTVENGNVMEWYENGYEEM